MNNEVAAASNPKPQSFDIDVWNANYNKSEGDGGKKPINKLFLVSICLYSIGALLCITAAVLTQKIWCYSRGGNTVCKFDHLKDMKFPGKSSPNKEELENWAKEFNKIRRRNTKVKDHIPQSKDEVCETFEKYPGIYNEDAPFDDKKKKIKEVKLYYFIFFAFFLFLLTASLMFFAILFLVAEHLMILKGGDAFENLNKCSLISGLICAVCAAIGCTLLGVGLGKVHPDFLQKTLVDTCKYSIKSTADAALVPGAIAAIFFLVAAPMSYFMYRE